MFEPTRAHEAHPVPTIRYGQRPPAEAVLLAYCEASALEPESVLTLSSEAAFLPENALQQEMRYGWPDPSGLLRGPDWSAEYPGIEVEITNVFKDEVPLFYLHVSRLPTVNDDVAGVSVVDEDGQPPGDDVHLLVTIVERDGEKRVYVYADFTGGDRKYWLVYQAVVNNPCDQCGSLVVEHREQIVPLPVWVFLDAEPIPGGTGGGVSICNDATGTTGVACAGIACWLVSGQSYGTWRLYINDGIVPDTRVPVPFRYKIEAEVSRGGQVKTYCTPWRSEVVLHPDSLLSWEQNEYVNGMKKLDDRLIADIIKPLIPEEELVDTDAVITYRVVTDSEFVTGSGRPDGLGYPYAYTSVETGNAPIINSLPGQAWAYYAYDAETLAATGLSGEERTVSIVLILTAEDGTVVASQRMAVSLEVGLSTKSITITSDFFPNASDNLILTVDATERVPGVDLSLHLDGQEAFDESGRWCVSWQAVQDGRNVVLKVNETYRPGYFARTYAVRCTLSRPLTLAYPPKPDDYNQGPWHIAVSNGHILRPGPESGDYWLYCFPFRRYNTYHEVPVVKGPRLVQTGRAPLVLAAGTSGSPCNLTVTINGRSVQAYCLSAEDGLVELAEDLKPGDVVNITYQAVADWQYPWVELDLNPRPGHRCLLPDDHGLVRHVPTMSLLGQTFYLYLRPAAKLTALSEVTGEIPQVAGRTEERLDLLLAHPAEKLRPMSVYAASSGEVIPFGSGDTYWVWDDTNPRLIHVFYPNLPLDDQGNFLDDYAVDYFYTSSSLALVPGSSRKDVAFYTLRPSAEEGALLLGRVTLDLPVVIPTVMDARRRGGGIREDLLKVAAEIEPESRHYWDIGYWDGEPWQRYGSGVVVLPEDVLAEDDGGDTKERIRQAIDKYKAWGTLLLARHAARGLRYPDPPGKLGWELVSEPDGGFTEPVNIQASTIWEE